MAPSRVATSKPVTSDVSAQRLVLAISQVAGATAALATHGDEATLRTAREANLPLIEAATSLDGRLIKLLGEGLLLSFPAERALHAVAALRTAREQANAVWQQFDPRCHVQVKMTIGEVLAGPLGAPADPRFDVYGHVLSQLFKAPAVEFALLPELTEHVSRGQTPTL